MVMQVQKLETLELVFDKGVNTITIPIPLPTKESQSRGINATTYGFNWKLRFSPVDAQLIQQECDHLGTSRMQFIRSVAIEAAKALRSLRHEERTRSDPSTEDRDRVQEEPIA